MEGFPSIKGAVLDKNTVRRIQKLYPSWSMFSVGKTKTRITPSGGIHFSGKETNTNCLSFEIKRGGGYIMISLFEYPKGLVFHAHIYYTDLDKRSKDGWNKVLQPIYEEIKNILETNY